MKKVLMGIALATLVASTSCSKTSSTSEKATAADSFKIEQATSDSISTFYGKMVGGYILSDYLNFTDEHKNDQMKEDLIKGIRLALGEGSSDGVLMGIQVGTRMAQELKDMESRGVPVDRQIVLKNFIKAFTADSVDMETLRADNQIYSGLMQRVSQMEMARQTAEIAESPEAKQNAISGKAYVDKIKAADPEVKTSESGLSYKITEKGDTTTISDRSMVSLLYTGRLIDGTVFDQTHDGQPATFAPANTVPGFAEGLKLLGKGGKATLYIPAELAYGLQAPEAIGPNQTLVFDVEIVDVQNR